ncbi:hypothetical protein [uncultured Shewanella sp.]|nr:hypothetical protein [uncultured Shewanella sp.]
MFDSMDGEGRATSGTQAENNDTTSVRPSIKATQTVAEIMTKDPHL